MAMPLNDLFLGIDLGGTRIKSCVIQSSGEVVFRHIVDTLSFRGIEPVLEDLSSIPKQILPQDKKGSLKAIGIGICGPTDFEKGLLITTPILPGWKNVPIAGIIGRKTGLQVVLDNDANLAVFGEVCCGAARGMENVIGFTIGTGVGGGIVINGQIYRGSHSFGAELGHMTVFPGGRICPCGNRGCLSVEASIQATVERYLRGGSHEDVSVRRIFDEAKSGRRQSLDAIMPMIEALSVGIANVLNIFDPDCVVISGGPAQSGSWFLALVVKSVQKKVFPDLFAKTKIILSQLGNFAGATGAAWLAKKTFG